MDFLLPIPLVIFFLRWLDVIATDSLWDLLRIWRRLPVSV